jgi:hypothetical protein
MYMLANATMLAGGRSTRTPETGTSRRKDLDFIRIPGRARVLARRADAADLDSLLSFASGAVGSALASKEVVARITAAHPDSVWMFKLDGKIVGGVALLMLNDEGLQALLCGSIDLLDPPVRYVVDPAVPPAGIYCWAVIGPSVAAEGILRVLAEMRAPLYARSNFYSMPNTEDGVRFTEKMGFHLIPGLPHRLYRYVRAANRPKQAENAA